MGEFRVDSTESTALFQDVVQAIGDGVNKAAAATYFFLERSVVVIAGSTKYIGKAFSSPDALRYMLAGSLATVEAIQMFRPLNLSAKAIQMAKIVEEFVSATRIVTAANVFLSGKFITNLRQGKFCTVLADLCFLVARVGQSALFAAKYGIKAFGNIAGLVGGIPTLYLPSYISMDAFFNGTFFSGIALSSIDTARSLLCGRNIAGDLADLINSAAEIALIVGAVTVGLGPLTGHILNIVAAASSVASTMIND